MSLFADQMLIRFAQEPFVSDLLTNQLGLSKLFETIYEAESLEVKEIQLQSVTSKRYHVPAFETVRTSGTDERLGGNPERVRVDRAQPRYGRLAWVEVFLELLLATKVHSTVSPIEKITVKLLLDELGPVNTLNDLRNALAARYSPDVVDAFFKRMRVTTIGEFKRRGDHFIEFVYKQPPPFDPGDPRNARTFRANVCFQFQPELKLTEAIQTAKLCRSILEHEGGNVETLDGAAVRTPFAFVVIFPDSVVADNFIPGVNAAQTKERIKTLFAAENMIAHFFV